MLSLAALISTLWLAATNQLILYIHPRYVVFSVVMAALGLILVIASLWRAARSEHDHEQHDHEQHDHGSDHHHAHGSQAAHAPAGRARGRILDYRRLLPMAATAIVLLMAAALIIVPPTTLTTATANQRVINSTQLRSTNKSVQSAASAPVGAFARFTVLDWSSLLRQTTDPSFYRDKPGNVVGFISRDLDDPKNMFYVSRFVITCCAVDAQPIGVPVYLPDWQNSFSADHWVRVTGSFDTNPSTKSRQAIALVPTATTRVDQPSEPYLY